MRPSLLAPLFVLAGCATDRAATNPAPAGAQAPAAPAQAATKDAEFAPANPTPWSYWPEEWNGQLLVLEVLPHGSTVREADVLARFDLRPLDDEIRKADLELKSAQVRHAALVERQQIEEEAAQSSLATARAGLERTKRALNAWKEQDLAFARRGDEIDQRRERSYIEDQKDELGQLEEMYKRDELVDGTEEIVLKRQKRALAITEDNVALSRDRAKKRLELDQTLEQEQREESARTQAEAVERQRRTQDIERRARVDALLRSGEELADREARVARLKRDREALACKAPRVGVFLHGATKDWRVGRTPARIDRGSTLSARAEIGCVADPAPRELRVDLQGGDLAQWKDGAQVLAKTNSGAKLPGVMKVDPWPRGDGVFEAIVVLDSPVEAVPVGARAELELVP